MDGSPPVSVAVIKVNHVNNEVIAFTFVGVMPQSVADDYVKQHFIIPADDGIGTRVEYRRCPVGKWEALWQP